MKRIKTALPLALFILIIFVLSSCGNTKSAVNASGFTSQPVSTAQSLQTEKPAAPEPSQAKQATPKPSQNRTPEPSQNETVPGVPSYALDVWHKIQRNGYKPLEGYKSQTFGNYEKLLPLGKKYIEHDVHPYTPGVNRGAERVVYVADGSAAYYTGDHYASFIQIE